MNYKCSKCGGELSDDLTQECQACSSATNSPCATIEWAQYFPGVELTAEDIQRLRYSATETALWWILEYGKEHAIPIDCVAMTSTSEDGGKTWNPPLPNIKKI